MILFLQEIRKSNYSDKKQPSGCLGTDGWDGEGWERGIRKLLGVMAIFMTLILVVITQVCTYVEPSNAHLNKYSLLYVSYNFLKGQKQIR